MEKVSVIIPVYNAEGTIKRCVDSLIYGEEKNIEIILVDDCSTDDSWSICQVLEQAHENVTCCRNSYNKGVSYTRNRGLEMAKGEYILFVDSDDWVSKEYVKTLLKTIEENPESLIICGLCLINEIAGDTQEFFWEKDSKINSIVGKDQFFELPKKFLMQQLWNKIFHKEIIKKRNIQFDETQTMGEDFQFVLDYIEALQCEQCIVVNKPLYYYIRANRNSLMSNFGLIQTEQEFERYKKLLYLCGNEQEIIKNQYYRAIEDLKQNYVYHIVRVKNMKKIEKMNRIESIMKDGYASKYYYQQKRLIIKEKIVELKKKSIFKNRLDT